MEIFLKKHIKWFVLAALIFTFAIVVHELLDQELAGFDTTVYNFVISFKSDFMTNFFKAVSFLASGPFLIGLSIALFFIFKNKKYGLLSVCSLAAVFILNQVLKLIFSRPRPFEWMLIEETGYSFPSGHSMAAMGFYGMLIYLIWQTKISKRSKIIWTTVLSVLIFFVGISRIYLGVHYTSDVLAGFALSLSYLIIATSLVSYYLKCQRNVKNYQK